MSGLNVHPEALATFKNLLWLGKCSEGRYALAHLRVQIYLGLVLAAVEKEIFNVICNFVRLHLYLSEASKLEGIYYSVLSGHLTKDMDKAPAMLLKRKIALMPPRVKGMDKVRRIMKNIEELRRK